MRKIYKVYVVLNDEHPTYVEEHATLEEARASMMQMASTVFGLGEWSWCNSNQIGRKGLPGGGTVFAIYDEVEVHTTQS